MKRKKRRKSHKGSLIKGMSKLLPRDLLVEEAFKSRVQDIMRGYAGIYALYKEKKLYYAGLASRDLIKRVGDHLKDKHARKWDAFKIFRINRVRYLKDLETLILNIVITRAKQAKGRVPRDSDLTRAIKEVVRSHEKKVKLLKRALR
jgi:hypothetical protein